MQLLKEVSCKFGPRFPDASVPRKATVYKCLNGFAATGSHLDRNRTRRRHMLTASINTRVVHKPVTQIVKRG